VATIKLDRAAMARLMASSAVGKAVTGAADSVASHMGHIEAHDGPVTVEVTPYSTQLRGAGVDIKHPAAVALEAKHGYLKKAARAAGLTIGRKK
jgi:hypothetical protein